MGLFEIDGTYDFAVHVSPSLSENILSEKYVDPATIFKVNILFEQDIIMNAYIDSDYFKKIEAEPFSSISVDNDFDNEESLCYRFIKNLTVTPSKSLKVYMQKIKEQKSDM